VFQGQRYVLKVASTKSGSDGIGPDRTGLDHGSDHGSNHGSDHASDHGSDHSKRKNFKQKKSNRL